MDRVEKDRLEVEVLAQDAGSALVAVRGELDIATVKQLETTVTPLLAAGLERLVLDVAELSFADSSAITLWLRWADALEEFELRNPSHLLRRLVSTMGLAGRLRLAP